MNCKNFFDYQEASLSGVLIKMTTLNTRYAVHTHNHYELEYQVSGHGSHSINGRFFQADEGDYYLLRPGDFHHMQPVDGPIYIIGICFAPVLMDAVLSAQLHALTAPLTGTLPAQSRGLFYHLAAQMEKETLERNRESGAMMTGCALAALSLFLRYAKPFSPAGHTTLSAVLDYLERNYPEPLTLEQAAAAANLSPYYFSGYFHRISGMTFSDYLARLRLAHVCTQMLKDPDCNLLTVAMDAGFGSYTSFYRVFEKCMGVSPSEWRASHTASSPVEVRYLKGVVLEIGSYLRARGLLP